MGETRRRRAPRTARRTRRGYDYVYLRGNPRGPHQEWWLHHAGCGRWIRVARDTATHAVLGVEPAFRPSGDEAGVTGLGDPGADPPRSGEGGT